MSQDISSSSKRISFKDVRQKVKRFNIKYYIGVQQFFMPFRQIQSTWVIYKSTGAPLYFLQGICHDEEMIIALVRFAKPVENIYYIIVLATR